MSGPAHNTKVVYLCPNLLHDWSGPIAAHFIRSALLNTYCCCHSSAVASSLRYPLIADIGRARAEDSNSEIGNDIPAGGVCSMPRAGCASRAGNQCGTTDGSPCTAQSDQIARVLGAGPGGKLHSVRFCRKVLYSFGIKAYGPLLNCLRQGSASLSSICIPFDCLIAVFVILTAGIPLRSLFQCCQ